ncbi:CAAX protease [Brachybacterium sp. YJGR34]|uniref:CAAX protease n=1 Tax=Brachybacterium sp. YJGR34 TaxID=2059911 RepID=UPI000E0C9F82|nr:CAAX protease [Brachybacterium sp. YJGR34]
MPRRSALPTPYHRLATLRPAWSAWSKPLLTLGSAFVAYVLLASVLLVLVILVLALLPGVNIALGVTSGDPRSGLDVLLALAMGALWLPAGMVGVRVGGWRPLGPTWSVAARLRRELLRPAGLRGAAAGGIVVVAASLAGAIAGGGADGAGAGATLPQLLLIALIVVVLAPLQAAGLELALRGVVLQALGTWLRRPLVPVLSATALALVGRELSAPVLLPALALALCAAVLAWKSGGLELPITLTFMITALTALVSAAGAGTGAGAGAAALNAGAAAPGTSAAALAATAAGAEQAALAGGIAAAVALLLVTAALCALIGRREGVRPLEAVGRPANAPVPEAVPF